MRTPPPLTTGSAHQEEDFLRPNSREEAQKLWEMEKLKMQQVLDKQQKQMVEDYQWLRQEEKSLVSSRGLPALAPSRRRWGSQRCSAWLEKPLFSWEEQPLQQPNLLRPFLFCTP